MSVALLINKEGDEDAEYHPVATEGTFLSFWLPILHAGNFEWIPLFQGGILLERADLPPLIQELEVFASEAKKLGETSLPYRSVFDRASGILDRLRLLLNEPFEAVYIG